MKSKIPFYAIAIFSLLLFSKCNKNESNNNIPFTTVDINLNINNPSNFAVQVVGGWVYIQGGSKGIIVYRFSENEFRAYDRHSTYQPEKNCIVAVDNSNITAEDPCSGSKFMLVDGSVSKGPAQIALRRYNTTFDGTFLRINN